MSEVAKLGTDNQVVVQVSTAALPELFIINLCASMTPMPAVPKSLTGFEKHKLYQVSRQEDGRRRFRLRLGFFTSEADAEWVLNSVRGLYPAAFTGCVSQEDLRYAADALPPMPVKAEPIASPMATLITPSVKPMAAPTPIKSAAREPVIMRTPPAPVTTRVPTGQPKQDFTLAAAPEKPKDAPKEPPALAPVFHVARGVDIPETNLELTDEYQTLAAPPAKPQVKSPPVKPVVTAQPAVTASRSPAAASINGPIRSATLINPPKVVDDYVPILDTTLTIRTLTKSEADDPNRPKWFVVQLALSEQPINLDTMPKLDIFAAYSLYSVALMENGGIRHALRLGFFRENVSAEAVMGYLKAFFPTPAITQISLAEHDRFAEPKAKPKPAAEPENVIKLDDKRAPAAAGTATRPAVTSHHSQKSANVSSSKAREAKPRISPTPAMRPQSFLSRLIGRQLD